MCCCSLIVLCQNSLIVLISLGEEVRKERDEPNLKAQKAPSQFSQFA